MTGTGPVRLIVNADDFGMSQGVSSGILHAHMHGIVTTTSSLMNAPGVVLDINRAQETCPSLGIGVHLVLTSGVPIRSGHLVSSLVMPNGRFPPIADIQLWSGIVKQVHLYHIVVRNSLRRWCSLQKST
jgi:predicted glycoside hydrolase/deacetylase ChbG (UPF0249 family)